MVQCTTLKEVDDICAKNDITLDLSNNYNKRIFQGYPIYYDKCNKQFIIK